MYNEWFKTDSWNTYATYVLIKENFQFVSNKSTARLHSGKVLTPFSFFRNSDYLDFFFDYLDS